MKSEGFRADTESAISDYPDLISDTTGAQQPGLAQCTWANNSSCELSELLHSAGLPCGSECLYSLFYPNLLDLFTT